MKKLLLILLTAFASATFAQTGSKNFIDQNYIEVTGKAEMEIAPNEIYLKIVINEKDLKGQRSVEGAEKSMMKKLKEIGIDISKNLVVKDMVSNFRNYWLKGSTINSVKEYQLKVEDANTAGNVFLELEKLDISNISVEKVDHSEIEKFRAEVKIKAIKAAKEKATSLTSAIDQNIGKAIYIQELNNSLYRPKLMGYVSEANIVARGISNSNKDPLPDIEFESIKLEYSILARFEIVE